MRSTTLYFLSISLYTEAMDTLTIQDMPVGHLQLSRESLVVGEGGGGVVGEVGGGGSQV